MNLPVGRQKTIKLRLQLQEMLQGYLSRETWTAPESAMLLSGLEPPENATGLPAAGEERPLGGFKYPNSRPLSEAQNTLRQWEEWCLDYNEAGDAYIYADNAPFPIVSGEQPEISTLFAPSWFIH